MTSFVLSLKLRSRPDVTKSQGDNIDYNSSDFETKINHKYTKIKFKICIIIDIKKE